MWTRSVVLVGVVVALVGGCGGSDEDSNNSGGTGGGGAGGASGAAGMAGTSGGAGGMGMTGGVGGGGTGGGGGFMLPECSMEPGPAMCGANACTAVEPGILCLKTCCTTDGQCGTTNNTNPMCISSVNTTMCPDETVGGQAVTGCCVEGSNECGITNIFPIGPPCVGRTSPTLAMLGAMLDAKNCDGTPVMTGGMGGMGGAGGMGGMGGDTADAGM